MKFHNTQPVKPDPEAEAIAQAIQDTADGIRKIRAGKLNDKALILLIQYASGVPQKDVKKVLDGIEAMPGLYLKKA